jgi:hypothetical protein
MAVDSEGFWSDRFHLCALMAGLLAHAEGRLHDSQYVRELAYGFSEGGAFRDDPVSRDMNSMIHSGSFPGHPCEVINPNRSLRRVARQVPADHQPVML